MPIKLPQNIEAENTVISAMLQFPEILSDTVDSLDPSDFYDQRNQCIFSAMCDLMKKKQIVDLATVADRVDSKIRNIGVYLSSILDKAFTSEIQTHVKLLLEHSALRKAIQLCIKSQKMLSECTSDVVGTLDSIQTQFLQLGVRGQKQQFMDMNAMMSESIERYKELQKGKDRGIMTGYFLLDHATGGFRGSQFIILAGRPGQGKTSLAMNILNYIAESGIKCGIFSMEMDRDELNDRQISQKTGINAVKLKKSGGMDGKDWLKVMEAASDISEWPIILDDEGGLTIAEIKRRARLMVKDGVKLIVIDQLSKIESNGKDRFEKAANAVNELSRLPKELRTPVILLAQINREAEKGKGDRWSNNPATWMLKNTGTLEEDADIILLIYRPFVYTKAVEDEYYANLEIAKHRGGPMLDIPLKWDGKRFQFKNEDEI